MPERFPIHGTPNEVKMLRDAVRATRRTPVIMPQPLPRRRRAAGGGSCKPSISLLISGAPNGGDLIIPTTVNSVTEDVTISLPATTSDVLAAFIAHSEISSGQLTCTSASGGSAGLPEYEVSLHGANGFSVNEMEFGTIANSGASDMTGGSFIPFAIVRRCCG